MNWSDCELEEQEFNFERNRVGAELTSANICQADGVQDDGVQADAQSRAALDVFTSDYMAEVRREKGIQTEALLKEILVLSEAYAQGEVAQGEVKDGAEARLQARTHSKLPATADGWALLAGKDPLVLCQELLAPADTIAFAEYLSEKTIQELLGEDVQRQQKLAASWPEGAVDSRVLELWTGDRWAVLVVSNYRCTQSAIRDIALHLRDLVSETHVMIRAGSFWRCVPIATLDATNTSVIVMISKPYSPNFEAPSAKADRQLDASTMLQMAFDWDGRMFVGQDVVRLKKLLVMQALVVRGEIEVVRVSTRVYKIQCGNEVCYADLNALGRGPYDWQGCTRVGNAQVSLSQGRLTHLFLPFAS